MGELVVNTFLTLDGVMQAPGGPEEDTEGDFPHGGWQAPYFDDASGVVINDHIQRMDAMLLGRKTYDIFAAHWPDNKTDKDIADKFNDVPKYVASRHGPTLQWQGSKLIEGDVPAAVNDIKQRHSGAHVWGSADLVQTLLAHDLVDRFDLWVYPLLLGHVKRLFADGTVPTGLRLTEATPFDKGAVHLVYQRTGKPRYGDMTVQAERTG